MSATGVNGCVPSELYALGVTPGVAALRSLVINVLPTGTAMAELSPDTTELIVTPKTGGASVGLGGSRLGGGGAGGICGGGLGGLAIRRGTIRGLGAASGCGGGGGGRSGRSSGGGRGFSLTSIST